MIFAVAGIGLLWLSSKPKQPAEGVVTAVPTPPVFIDTSPDLASSSTVDDKLRKLKELHEANLITDQDFEKKKSEILDHL